MKKLNDFTDAELNKELQNRKRTRKDSVDNIITASLIKKYCEVFLLEEDYEYIEVDIPNSPLYMTLKISVEGDEVIWYESNPTVNVNKDAPKFLKDMIGYFDDSEAFQDYSEGILETPRVKAALKKQIKPYELKIKEFNKTVKSLAKKHNVVEGDIWEALESDFNN